MKRHILMLGLAAMLSMPGSLTAQNRDDDGVAKEQIVNEESGAATKDSAGQTGNGESFTGGDAAAAAAKEQTETSVNEESGAAAENNADQTGNGELSANGDASAAKKQTETPVNKSDVKESKGGLVLEWKDIAIISLVLALAALGYCVVKLRRELAAKYKETAKLTNRNKELKEQNNELKEQNEACVGRLRERERVIAQLEERAERERREREVEKRAVVEEQNSRSKVLYGKFVESQNGVAARFLSEIKEPSASIMLMPLSENMAVYRLVDGIQADVFSGAVAACDVLSGDLMDFSAINTVEDGMMMLSGGVWSITKMTRIELLK